MATFYCIHGATFNGDGTTSAEATVDGGVGAFNEAISCLDGTNAVLTLAPKPYTVIFKTNHLGVDITLIFSANFTIAYGIGRPSKLTYVFDDGTTWSSESGLFTLQFNAGYLVSAQGSADTISNACADLISLPEYGLVIAVNYTTSTTTYFNFHDGIVSNMYFKDITPQDTAQRRFGIQSMKYSNTTLIHCKKDVVEVAGTNYYQQIKQESTTNPSKMNIDGLVLNFKSYAANTTSSILLDGTLSSDEGLVKNISFTGDVPANPWSIGAYVFNMVYPTTMDLTLPNIYSEVKKEGDDTRDFRYTRNGVITEWTGNSLYPTYSAKLAFNTPWVVKVDTSNFIDRDIAPIYEIDKIYDLASAVKTLTVEVLIPASFVNPTNLDWWANFQIEHTDGTIEHLTTCSTKLIEVSSVIWSATTYSSITYNTYKFSVTTALPIKQNSTISASLYTTKSVINANEFYFIDPEIGVT